VHVHPSFTTPLQLSSLPATHVSDADGAMLQLPHLPAAQVSLPDAHLPKTPPAEQRRVWPFVQAQPSLAVPLQLSSLPATHVSPAAGAMLQAPHAPLPHVCVPPAHVPFAPPAEQARVWPLMQVQPSFATPLHVLSSPLTHVSEAAGAMLQPFHLPLPSQVCVPPAHLPFAPASEHARV
jgi:hypothetical protein